MTPGSYVVNYGFIYALCGGQVCLDFYMENANLELTSSTA